MTATITHSPAQDAQGKIRCLFCECGCVWLRWRRALLLHLDHADVACAHQCLNDVLQEPPCGLSLGEGAFCACHAEDGFYYLLCQERVVLRLSEDEAQTLRTELSSMRAALNNNPESPLRVM